MYIRYFRRWQYVAWLLLLTIAISPLLHAGSLNPPGPLSASATGYTLNDIYERIANGTDATGYYSPFPVASPGSSVYTLTQIYNALPGGTVTNATVSDVTIGKTFITRVNGVMTFSTGMRKHSGLPATGQTASYAVYDDGYNELYAVGFSSAVRTRSYTMYYYTGGLVETTNVNLSSVTVDNRTGLMWVTDGNLLGASTTWADAITWCENLDYAGFTDWRMPNIMELQTLSKIDTYSPAIDTTTFRNTVSFRYWSSTESPSTPSKVWTVNADDGTISSLDSGDKTSNLYSIRPVRSGPE